MTIHAAKGLEFPSSSSPTSAAGRPAADDPRRRRARRAARHDARARALRRARLRRAQAERAGRERGEERRVIHVAVTRAERRLIVSGAVDLEPGDDWGLSGQGRSQPIRWITPLMLAGPCARRGCPESWTRPSLLERDGPRRRAAAGGERARGRSAAVLLLGAADADAERGAAHAAPSLLAPRARRRRTGLEAAGKSPPSGADAPAQPEPVRGQRVSAPPRRSATRR